jgi:hypothetical protein
MAKAWSFSASKGLLCLPPTPPGSLPIRVTPLSEIEAALTRRIGSIDLATVVQDYFDRKRGRV